MKKKHYAYILIGIISLQIIIFAIYIATFVQPKIYITPQINQVSKEQYEKAKIQVMYADKGIEKFKKIYLTIKIIAPFALINNAHIEKSPSEQYLIQPYLKNNDKILILGGGMSANGKGTEYSEDITIYMKDISESDLKNIVGDLKIIVSWHNIWRKEDNKIFYIKDYLK